MRDLIRGLAMLLAAAAGTAALVAAGWVEPALALPLGAPASIPSWWARVGPAVATFAGFRLVAMAVGTYLVAVLVLAGAARAAGRGHVQRWVTALVPRSLRGPVALLAGVCVAANSAGGAGLAGATTVPFPTKARAFSSVTGLPSPSFAPSPSLAPSSSPSGGQSAAGAVAGAPPSLLGKVAGAPTPADRSESRGALQDAGPRLAPPPVLSPLGSAQRAAAEHQPARPLATPRRRPGVGASRAAGATHHGEPSAAGPPAGAPIAAGVWVVQPGQSFWSIAEAVVGSTGGESAADLAAVASYWSRLIAANQHHLPVPGDPNLLFVGDRLVLPLPR